VDIDAVRLYLAGKACGWHAGVLLAAPTVVHDKVQNLIIDSIFETIKSKFKI
jgi:hypothetical protein